MQNKSHSRPLSTYKHALKYEIAFEYYIDPKNETFDNAYKSALKAGIPESSARNITSSVGWKSKLDSYLEILNIAESNLLDLLVMDVNNYTLDEDGNQISKMDPRLLKIKSDISMFIAETVGRKKYNKKVLKSDLGGVVVEKNTEIKDLFKFTTSPLP